MYGHDFDARGAERFEGVGQLVLDGEVVRVVVVERNLVPVVEVHRACRAEFSRGAHDLVGHGFIPVLARPPAVVLHPRPPPMRVGFEPQGEVLAAVFVDFGQPARLGERPRAVEHRRVVPVAVEGLPDTDAVELLRVASVGDVLERLGDFQCDDAVGAAAEVDELAGGRAVMQAVVYAAANVLVPEREVLHRRAVGRVVLRGGKAALLVRGPDLARAVGVEEHAGGGRVEAEARPVAGCERNGGVGRGEVHLKGDARAAAAHRQRRDDAGQLRAAREGELPRVGVRVDDGDGPAVRRGDGFARAAFEAFVFEREQRLRRAQVGAGRFAVGQAGEEQPLAGHGERRVQAAGGGLVGFAHLACFLSVFGLVFMECPPCGGRGRRGQCRK